MKTDNRTAVEINVDIKKRIAKIRARIHSQNAAINEVKRKLQERKDSK